MKIAVLGATGSTGNMVVQEALRRGYSVVALARTPSSLDISHENLTILKADMNSIETLKKAMIGIDAVISCAGSKSTKPPITFYSEGMANLIEAMKSTGVKRLIALSSGAVKSSRDPNYPLFFELVIKRFVLQHVYADMRKMEAIISESDLEWTIIRPSRLTDKPANSSLREEASEYSIKNGFWTSRNQLAIKLLDKLEDESSKRTVYAVAN